MTQSEGRHRNKETSIHVILVVLCLLLTWRQPGFPPLCSCWQCQQQRPSLLWRQAYWRGSQSWQPFLQIPTCNHMKQLTKGLLTNNTTRFPLIYTQRRRPTAVTSQQGEEWLTSSLLGAFSGAVAATASNLMGVVVSLKISDTSWVIASCIFPFNSWEDDNE